MEDAARPHPQISSWSAEFWQGIAAHQLVIQQCSRCMRWQHPPLPLCPKCGSSNELIWDPLSGKGRLYSYSVIHRPPLPVFVPPYAIGLVQLTDAPVRVLSNIVHDNLDQLDEGIPVEIFYFQDQGFPLFGFAVSSTKSSPDHAPSED